MTKRASLLPKIEVIIIGIFFLSFVIWMVPKCSATKEEYREAEVELAEEDAILDEATPKDTIAQEVAPAVPTPLPRSAAVPGLRQQEQLTSLFVTLENLNMREEPRVGGKLIDRLSLYDEVFFMNEVTDTTQEINLGKIVTNEPWVKVRNKKGQVGWVYGAGVHYYKMKLEVE
ncbi:MAG: SH3 domain-containing protein [Saprospiraceae bacterium]